MATLRTKDPHNKVALDFNENLFPPLPGENGITGAQVMRRNNGPERTPGSMNSYERKYSYQLGLLLFLFSIAIVNVYLNFQVVEIFKQAVLKVQSLPEPEDVPADQVSQMLEKFETFEAEGAAACDILAFSEDFSKLELETVLDTTARILDAAAHTAAIFVIPVTFLIKMVISYSLVFDEFPIKPSDEVREEAEASRRAPQATDVQPATQLIRTKAAKENIIVESMPEKKLRLFLRSETILYGLAQLVQDIPFGAASLLFMLFLLRERGILCYESFTLGNAEKIFSVDEVDGVILGQISVIMLSMFVNLVLNLSPRWVAYFYHQSAKQARRPTSITVRIFQITVWVVVYIAAILLPVLSVLFSKIGEDIIGVGTTGERVLLVFIIASSISVVIALFLICFTWGNTVSRKICLACVVCEAGVLACDGCIEIEGLDLILEGCC